MTPKAKKTVSIIAPCYNEAAGVAAFLDALAAVADEAGAYDFEFVLVDDGSRDETEAVLRARIETDPRVRVVALSRNHGHQRAITAGLDFCAGDYAIVMDADLQDPPALIPAILAALDDGWDVVHTVRRGRRSDGPMKRLTAWGFYRVMRRWVLPELPENAGDFKGFNRRARLALAAYGERVRFLRGLVATLGFRQTAIPFVRPARHAGRSKFPASSMLRLARDAMVSNTVLPLRLFFYFGVLTLLAVPLYAGACIAWHVCVEPLAAPGSWILIGVVSVFSGLILTALGLIGEYLKCLVLETKQRPLYTVRALHNIEKPKA